VGVFSWVQRSFETGYRVQVEAAKINGWMRLCSSLSAKPLRRYLESYREEGIGFIRHGNRGREPRTSSTMHSNAAFQGLMKEKYFDSNVPCPSRS